MNNQSIVIKSEVMHPYLIPRRIILFFHDKMLIPEIYNEAFSVTKRANSLCEIIYADDVYLNDFIVSKYSKDILKIYNLNRIPASRSDLARLLLLFEYGGFYIDVSMEVRKPLKLTLDSETEVLLVRRDDAKRYSNDPKKAHVINGIIGAKPKSKYIEQCIDLALMHLKNGLYNKNVWRATGPFVLNEVLSTFNQQEKIKIVNFTDLLKTTINYRRPKESANTWMKQQETGIIDPNYYQGK